MRKHRDANPRYHELDKLNKQAYRQTPEGKAKYNNDCGKRRALKKSAETSGSSEIMKLIYLHCPEGYVVDHIIPLSKGGLHHEDNLQYLPKNINLRKGSKLDFDCSEYVICWKSIIF